MRAVIIEDEALVAKDLRNALAEIAPEIEVVAELDSLASAQAWFEAHDEPEVLFCDIQLSDGSSFDLFRRSTLLCPVIFTTAYDEYALRAFKVNSVDYLLKPIDREELRAALDKLRRRLFAAGASAADAAEIRKALNAAINNAINDAINQSIRAVAARGDSAEARGGANRYKERFFAHGKGAMTLVPVQEVALFHKEEVIFLVTREGKKLLTDFNALEDVEELTDPKAFFRANRQTLVHIDAVEGFRADYAGKLRVRLKNLPHWTLDVSREKASAFKRWLG